MHIVKRDGRWMALNVLGKYNVDGPNLHSVLIEVIKELEAFIGDFTDETCCGFIWHLNKPSDNTLVKHTCIIESHNGEGIPVHVCRCGAKVCQPNV